MPHEPRHSPAWRNLFSVRLDNGIWQICDTNDITILPPPPTQADQ